MIRVDLTKAELNKIIELKNVKFKNIFNCLSILYFY